MTHIQQIIQTLEAMPTELQQEVADFVAFLAQRHIVTTSSAATAEQIAAARRAGFGSLRGKIHMSADFDEPLEDFKDYM